MARAAMAMAAMRKNMRALTPPRNSTPMEMVAITMNAPMSGCRSSSRPTTSTASAMGHTARRKFSRASIFLTM